VWFWGWKVKGQGHRVNNPFYTNDYYEKLMHIRSNYELTSPLHLLTLYRAFVAAGADCDSLNLSLYITLHFDWQQQYGVGSNSMSAF